MFVETASLKGQCHKQASKDSCAVEVPPSQGVLSAVQILAGTFLVAGISC